MNKCLLVSLTMLGTLYLGSTTAAKGDTQYYFFDSFFDVFTELSVSPDSDPMGVRVSGQTVDTGQFVPMADLNMQLRNPSFTPALDNLTLQAQQVSGDVFEVRLSEAPDYIIDSFFDVFFDIEIPNDNGIVLEPNGGIPQLVDKPVVVGIPDSFFDVFFKLEVPDTSPGQNLISFKLHLSAIAPDVILNDVWVDDNYGTGIDSFFDVFFDIQIPADSPGFDPSQPILIMEMTGIFTPEPASIALLAGLSLTLLRRQTRHN